MTPTVVRGIAIGAALLVVQHSVMTHVSVFGSHPDLLLLFAIAAGAIGGFDRGMVCAFCAGIATDVFSTTPLGLSALSYMAATAIAAHLSDEATELPWVLAGIAALASAAAVVVLVALGGITDSIHATFGETFSVLLSISMFDAVLVLPLIGLLRRAWPRARRTAW